MTDYDTDQMTTCAYCGSDVPLDDDVPDMDDDLAWSGIEHHHWADCEWVMTRAHRLPDDTLVS